MSKLLIYVGASAGHAWELEVVTRLTAAGHAVSVRRRAARPTQGLDFLLKLERGRQRHSLARRIAPLPESGDGDADIAIDLTGGREAAGMPLLTLAFNGHRQLDHGLADMVATGALPELVARLDGVAVGRARPMLGDRLWLSRDASDMLAGAVSLIEAVAARHHAGALHSLAECPASLPRRPPSLLAAYLPRLAGGLIRRRLARLLRREFYWQTAYRRSAAQDIAGAGTLDGAPFTVLPDDGARFYADPFLIEAKGETWLFLEEYPYATGKGVIAAARLEPDGQFGTPCVVLEEPHHLSYPQVFAHEGEIWMIPESSAGRELVLYRAADFPASWVRDTVLVAGLELNDMTLIRRDGRFWLIGTERRGGNASDTMVIYGAAGLRGPWTPHRLNPILIDRSAARPGGPPIEREGRLLLPVQDGTAGYGGGLGLVEVLRLDADEVAFGPVQPISSGTGWARRGIHTLSQASGFEAIDSSG